MIEQFDKDKFQQDLESRLDLMVTSEVAVNNGQLYSFFDYFLNKYSDKYDKETWQQKLETDENLKIALRVLMVFSTLALTIHDDRVFSAAVEVFPTKKIVSEYVQLAKDVLEQIEKNPADDTRKLFIQGLGSNQFPMRMDYLQKSLNNVLVEVL